MSDYISRQAAIEALHNHYEVRNPIQNAYMDEAVMEIMGVPTADVRENRVGKWIPCIERMPEEGQTVLITQVYSWQEFETGNDVTIAQYRNKYFTWYRYQDDWRKHTSIMHHGDICPGNEYVIAWMPLPEPYKEGED